jgi:formate hydrogenlyase subunit 3/multisubunit Na+/H+ antiporter MnhD subunit
VLSGAMIKVGLLGLLRMLPLGAVAMESWGAVCMGLGIASTFVAAFFGMVQTNPKTVLAYSSVSQMGLATVGLGAGLLAPEAAGTIFAALLLFAAHHAIAKASLFLGVGVAACEMPSLRVQRCVMAGLIVAALALAGLPLTAGFAAKAALKDAAAAAPGAWSAALKVVLPLTGITTTLLVSRFLWLVRPGAQPAHGRLKAGMVAPWAVLTASVVAVFLALRWYELVLPKWTNVEPEAIWAGAWSILTAAVVAVLVIVRPAVMRPLHWFRVPEGDLVVPAAKIVTMLRGGWRRAVVAPLTRGWDVLTHSMETSAAPAANALLARWTRRLENDLVAGLLMVAIAAAVLATWFW